MKLKIEIDMNNDAFANEYGQDELARCLTRTKAKLVGGSQEGPIHDTNGNLVGEFKIEED